MSENGRSILNDRLTKIVSFIRKKGECTQGQIAVETDLTPSTLEKYLRVVLDAYPDIKKVGNRYRAKKRD